MQTYKAKSGKIQYRPSVGWLERAIRGDASKGFCLACGATADGVEPDARRYTCEACDAPKVYGAEELLLMNICHN
jgi:hypothetical protein